MIRLERGHGSSQSALPAHGTVCAQRRRALRKSKNLPIISGEVQEVCVFKGSKCSKFRGFCVCKGLRCCKNVVLSRRLVHARTLIPRISYLQGFKMLQFVDGTVNWPVFQKNVRNLVTRIAATSKSQIASDCNRNSKNHCDSENTL